MTAGLFAVLLLIALYMPFISLLAVWFLPLPFIVFVLRNQFHSAFYIWAASLLVGLLIGSVPGLLLALIFVSGGLIVGELYRRGRSAFGVLLGGSLAYTAGVIVTFILSILLLDSNILTNVLDMMKQAIDRTEQMAASLGEDTGNFEAMSQVLEHFRYLAPAFLVFLGVAYALITQLIAAPILKRLRLGRYVEPWVPFREWRFPKSFLWYYLILLLIGFFQSFTTGSPWFIVYYNLIVILEITMLVQGFSFLFFFMHLKKVRKGISIAVMAVVFILWVFLMPFVRILGIIDLGFDLRERLRSS